MPIKRRPGFKLAGVPYGIALVSGKAIYGATGANTGLAIGLSGWQAAPIWVLAGVLVTGGVGLIFWNNQRKQIARERERMQQAQELANERLVASQALQAKEAADSANRAKSEFLATMSHEIRTPLNGVIGTAELMLDTPLDPQQREYMTTVRTSAEALLAIINDILDFSKIEEGKVVLDHTMFDLRQPVIDVMKIASARVGDRELELVLDVAADVPACVYGDPARLRQVLLNLVANAVKFTKEGHVIVRVTRRDTEPTEGRTWLRFAVIDTGIGIASETRARLFEKFTQADASTTRKFGGTGLGLAIGRKLVQLMGGEIGLESELGHGSLFWFILPLQVDELKLPMVAAPSARVLVADDLPASADAISGMLRALNVVNATATTPGEGIAQLRAAAERGEPFDLALVDQSFASASDGEFVRTVRATPEFRALKLVMLGMPNRRRDSAAAFPPEYSALVVKPVLQADQLIDVIRQAKDGAPLTSAPSGTVFKLSRSGLRMLVAEDNNVNRAVVGGMLKKLGCVVEFAENGAEAVAKTRLAQHDLIFMDCLMPEMDGWTATLEIRRLDSRTPIVATTANATADDRSRCMKVGMNDYLSKPLRMPELVRVIERWVG